MSTVARYVTMLVCNHAMVLFRWLNKSRCVYMGGLTHLVSPETHKSTSGISSNVQPPRNEISWFQLLAVNALLINGLLIGIIQGLNADQYGCDPCFQTGIKQTMFFSHYEEGYEENQMLLGSGPFYFEVDISGGSPSPSPYAGWNCLLEPFI